ncbi:MAG: hypothetical protein ACI4OT_01075 [Bacilli bacterium]
MFRFIVKFLKILIIACLIGVALRIIDVLLYKKSNIEKEQEISQTINEKVVEENIDTDNLQDIKNVVDTNKKEENKKVAEKENIKEADTTILKNIENKKTEQVDEERQLIAQTVDDTKEQAIEKENEQTNITEKKEEISQEEIKQEQITEEYKINEQMINKIKTVIQNNETEDMKIYGYEIVIDSTIPELTNEFTFTEQRVINKITWKCGIIKIYARDYYFNGNHISTQCFII